VVRPQMEDGEDDLQIWKVGGNIRSRGTSTRGGPTAWVFGGN